MARTIVDDDAGDTELLGYLCERLGNVCRLLKVEAQTKISILADAILKTPRGKRDLVVLGGEGVRNGDSDLRPSTENEQHRGGHDVCAEQSRTR